jgi:hypothetical protein
MLMLAIAALAACKREPPPAPSDPLLDATALCAELFGSLKSELEGACSTEEEARPEYAYLVRHASSLERDCVASLSPDSDAKRVELRAAPVRECAKALGALGWKRRLAEGSIASVPACRGLVRGKQSVGQPCEIDTACVDGLFCDAKGVRVGGACRPLVTSGEPCAFRTGPQAGFLSRSTCASPSESCRGASSRQFPMGFDEVDPETPAAPIPESTLGLPRVGSEYVRRGLDQVVRREAPGDPDISDPEHGLGPASGSLSPKLRLSSASARAGASPPPPGSDAKPPPPTCQAVATAACTDDPDCATGLRCVAGSCRDVLAGVDQPCDETADCEPSAFCSIASRAGARPVGRCQLLKSVGSRCSSSLQCAGVCDVEGRCRPLCGAR